MFAEFRNLLFVLFRVSGKVYQAGPMFLCVCLKLNPGHLVLFLFTIQARALVYPARFVSMSVCVYLHNLLKGPLELNPRCGLLRFNSSVNLE